MDYEITLTCLRRFIPVIITGRKLRVGLFSSWLLSEGGPIFQILINQDNQHILVFLIDSPHARSKVPPSIVKSILVQLQFIGPVLRVDTRQSHSIFRLTSRSAPRHPSCCVRCCFEFFEQPNGNPSLTSLLSDHQTTAARVEVRAGNKFWLRDRFRTGFFWDLGLCSGLRVGLRVRIRVLRKDLSANASGWCLTKKKNKLN